MGVKKVLQLCHKPPFPEVDGGCLEMAKMSRFFDESPQFELHILSVHTKKHPFKSNAFKKQLNYSIFESVYVNIALNPFSALYQLIINKSYHLSRFRTKKIKQRLVTVLSENTFDYVLLEGIFVGQFIDTIKKYSTSKIILNAPNIEFEIWERLAKNTSSLLKRKYLEVLAKQLKKEENSIYKKLDGIIAITEKDQHYFQEHFPTKHVITVPFLLDLKQYKVLDQENKHILNFFHLGSMDWQPNIEGIKWFIQETWLPHFTENKNIMFITAGKNMPKSILEFNKGNIEVVGYVKNAKKFMSSNHVMIVPLKAGSGLRVKILEGMALGKCVISTSIGAEGINYTDNQNILIANSTNDFITHINAILANPNLISEIGKNARILMEQQYSHLLLNEAIPKFLETINE